VSAALQHTLGGGVCDMADMAAVAIERLRTFEPAEGYYVAFSGGKDSIVTLDLVRRAGVKHDAHFHLTTVDPPEVVRFVREHYPDVEFDRPKKSMFRLIIEHRTPPTRIMRYCCKDLKEHGGEGREIVVTGVRWAESQKRKQRRMIEHCLKDGSKRYLHPIIDWEASHVWAYIHGRGLAYPSPYDEGYTRIGCILCPMQRPWRKHMDAERYPRHYQAYLKAFEKMLAEREKRGMANPIGWKTAEDVMQWWIDEVKPDGATGQEHFGDDWDQPAGIFDQEAEA
jgi:phosphoadenosine phosphosulfate reductase